MSLLNQFMPQSDLTGHVGLSSLGVHTSDVSGKLSLSSVGAKFSDSTADVNEGLLGPLRFRSSTVGDSLAQVTKNFFDRALVMHAMDKANRSVLARFGAQVRLTARRSIRKSSRPSDPGKPPHSHTGLLRNFIFYSLDPDGTLVVGPAKLNGRAGGGATPSVLERGGTVRLQPLNRHHAFKNEHQERSVRIQARPYMAPALQKMLPRLPKEYAGAFGHN